MTDTPTPVPHEKARILAEALPNMRRHSGETFVVKYGGHALSGSAEADGLAKFASDIVLLRQVGINPIVVHGGGPQIGATLKRLGIETRFVDGLRVTDGAAMQVVEMVLRGLINSEIVAAINQAGGNALGLSGVDANLIRVEKLLHKGQDIGFVGQPRHVRGAVLRELTAAHFIPVIAPLGVDAVGTVYNINADTVAGAVAGAIDARRLLLLTDVPGVLDAGKTLIPQMTDAEARALIQRRHDQRAV